MKDFLKSLAFKVLAGIALFLICLKYGDQWEQALFERFKK